MPPNNTPPRTRGASPLASVLDDARTALEASPAGFQAAMVVLVTRDGNYMSISSPGSPDVSVESHDELDESEDDDCPAPWDHASVADFLSCIGLRSRELVTLVATVGRTGMLAADLGPQIGSDVTGLGKRFWKLERDVIKFAPGRPSPAKLVGQPGEKRLVLDSSFVEAHRGTVQS